jgi:hypothetical protein
MPEEKKYSEGPLICKNDEPLDDCLLGEQHLERIFHKED